MQGLINILGGARYEQTTVETCATSDDALVVRFIFRSSVLYTVCENGEIKLQIKLQKAGKTTVTIVGKFCARNVCDGITL